MIIFLFYLTNISADEKEALKKSMILFVIYVLPFEIIIPIFTILLDYVEQFGSFYYILFYVLFFLLMVEIFNKLTMKLGSKINSKNILKYEKEDEIKKKFSKYCKINNVCVVESDVANAFATGIINKDIYLTTKLIENLNEKEIEAIIAHEVGHHYHKHLLKTFTLIIGMYIFIYLLPVDEGIKDILYILYCLFTVFGLGIIQNRFEKEADLFAAKVVGSEHMISALEKLAELIKIPKKTGKIFNILFKHPSIEERIKYLERLNEKQH